MEPKRTEQVAVAVPRHNATSIIPLATIVAPHGINGWLKLDSTTPQLLLAVGQWQLASNTDDWQELAPEQTRDANGRILAKFPNINTRDEAAAVVGTKVGLRRGDMPVLPDGEYYWCDLLDLEVLDVAGKSLGTVAKVHATAANEVLELAGKAKSILVPFTHAHIEDVDFAKLQIKTNWQEDY